MMLCKECGKELDPGDTNCPHCGTPQEQGAASEQDPPGVEAPATVPPSKAKEEMAGTSYRGDRRSGRCGDRPCARLCRLQGIVARQDRQAVLYRIRKERRRWNNRPRRPRIIQAGIRLGGGV